jgi:hypothetical protein
MRGNLSNAAVIENDCFDTANIVISFGILRFLVLKINNSL